MIICKKCGSENPDGNIFCQDCGAELDVDILPDNIDEQGNVIHPDAVEDPVFDEQPESAAKKAEDKKAPRALGKPGKPRGAKPSKGKKGERIRLTEGQRAARQRTVRFVFILLMLAAIVAGVMLIYTLVTQGRGYTAAMKIPLGRNVEFAESETGLKFSERSANGMINSMADFDYICISDKTVKVSGSEQPKWVIMLYLDDADMISEVEYYDFTQLKLNWKGRRMAEKLSEDSLSYGMPVKNVNKTLSLKPYYIRRNVQNDSIYCYRYYYTDESVGYDRAFNYYVGFSDTDMTVRSIDYSEIEYAKVILNADTGLDQIEARRAALAAQQEAKDRARSEGEDDPDQSSEEDEGGETESEQEEVS